MCALHINALTNAQMKYSQHVKHAMTALLEDPFNHVLNTKDWWLPKNS